MIKRLMGRVRQADFRFLSPQIQQAYAQTVQQYMQVEVQQQQKLQMAQAGFIPTGGYLVVCDLYVQDPTDSTGVKTRRARLPYESLQWLIKKLEAQGSSLSELEKMNQGAVAQMADMFLKRQGAPAEGMAASQ
jgi:hypothetical protein